MRHPPRRLRLPIPARRGARGAPRRHHPPRTGPHVVRGHGDDEVVERPVAQRVLRRVHLHARRRRDHALHRRLDHFPDPREGLGLQPGSALLDPPGRGRDQRPARRRGELRRHHLRQGGRRPDGPRGLRWPGELLQGDQELPGRPCLRQCHIGRPARRAGEGLGARPGGLDPRVASGGGRDHPAHVDRDRRRRHHHLRGHPPGDPRGVPGHPAPAPCGDRLLRSDRPGRECAPGAHRPRGAGCGRRDHAGSRTRRDAPRRRPHPQR